MLTKSVFLAALFAASALFARERPQVIFDTDMYTDFDDVGAMAVLHSLADAGECDILATVASTAETPAVGMVEIINAWYGRPDIPVGACASGGTEVGRDPAKTKHHRGSYDIYAEMVAADPRAKHKPADAVPEAVRVYREALAKAKDRSVTVLTVGFTTNLRRLLESTADDLSPLDGKTLVAQKVKAWYAMACRFPNGYEYNSGSDAASSQVVFRDWPTPAYFLDFNYGVEVRCGIPAARKADGTNPVNEVFKRALTRYGELDRGHPSWDEVAVLAAVRDWRLYFGVERGRFTIDGKGVNTWTKDDAGIHYVFTVKDPKKAVGEIVDELIARGPLSER